MTEVIGVRFKESGKIYYFDPAGEQLAPDTHVVVETARGLECGMVAMENKSIPDTGIVKPLRKVVRRATEEDMRRLAEYQEKERCAFEICSEKIISHKLDMKLVDAEYAFDGSKLLFYFTADGRVDFRELVKDLASIFRIRIELRQIGVRDEAKMLGGLGICGQPFCCARFLNDFQPVSIKMAKEQGLSLNPTKISGSCGRLMCCLKYEQPAYDHLLKITPKPGSRVSTPQGPGQVTEVNLLKGKVRVRLDQHPDGVPELFDRAELKVLHGGKQTRENPAPEQEELIPEFQD